VIGEGAAADWRCDDVAEVDDDNVGERARGALGQGAARASAAAPWLVSTR